MKSKKQLKSEETQQKIIEAARQLFSQRGFHTVTIREIAKEAGCSHTTIYIYFKDKEALLEEIALPPLTRLYEQLESCLNDSIQPLAALKQLSQLFLAFGIQNRNMYPVYFTAKAERVDNVHPQHAISKIRLNLFQLYRSAVGRLYQIKDEEKINNVSRIFLYQVHGMVMSYIDNEEPDQPLLKRLELIHEQAIELLTTGLTSGKLN
jgi:AcrR family transcriptional regulator